VKKNNPSMRKAIQFILFLKMNTFQLLHYTFKLHQF